jgi:UDP-2,4-diacetamido-2,4,6-trideoxy-beta-L-altropyranose hydrolase
MSSPLVVVRTVCGGQTGYGHLTRCLSLAEALHSEGAKTVFLLDSADHITRKKVADFGADLLVLAQISSLRDDLLFVVEYVKDHGATAVVLDGYLFDQQYLNRLSREVCCLFIDDLRALQPSTALILSQSPGANESDYALRESSSLLLGLEYALIAPLLVRYRLNNRRTIRERADRLLISFGGSDPNRLCAKALQGLASSKYQYEIKLVAGGGIPSSLAAAKDAAEKSHHKVEVLEWVDDMPALMAWADMALCGSGVTSYEMCCLGLPMVVVTPVDNQIPISRGLEKLGLIRHLGWWENVECQTIAQAVDALSADRRARDEMSRAGQLAVDGLGAKRVAQALLEEAEKWPT